MSHGGLTSYSSFAMAAVSGGGGAQRGGVLEEVALDRRRVGVDVGWVRQSAECRAGRERASTKCVDGGLAASCLDKAIVETAAAGAPSPKRH